MAKQSFILQLILIASLASAALAASAQCGADYSNAKCTDSEYPCCSEANYCGRSALHCSGGCQPQYSLVNAANSSSASCLVQRPGGQQCISGMYTFDNNTWLLRIDAYNGNPLVADFTVDANTLDAQNMIASGSGGMYLRVVKPNPLTVNGVQQGGVGGRLSSTSYLPIGGKACAKVRQSGAKGIITAFILMADNKDEVDWEWTGKSSKASELNWFANGIRAYGVHSSEYNGTETVNEGHEYCIDYQKNQISWSIDGANIRTETYSGSGYFPQNPARVQISIWDSATAGGGTVSWAGGYADWSQASNGGFYGLFEYIKIQCPGDASPTGPPTRPAGYSKPDINKAPEIQSVVAGTSDYVPGSVGTDAPLPSPNPSAAAGISPSGSTGAVAGRESAFVASAVIIGALVCAVLSAFA